MDEYNSGRFNEDLNHDDDGDAMYAMLSFSGELSGGTPYSGNVGVRYVDNSTGSNGEITVPESFDYSDVIAGKATMTDTIDQDLSLLAHAQQGMHSEGFQGCWLNEIECRVSHFHEELERQVTDAD